MRIICPGLLWGISVFCVAATEEDLTDFDLATLMTMEVKVTSQKRLQDIEDVPASIMAFSTEYLARARAKDVSQISTLVPGLVFDNLAGYSQVYLRGVGSDSFAPGANHSIAVYVDGIYVPFYQVADQSFLDVERVEVMKGPQGTLYGRNATAGAINVITRKPDVEPSIDVSAEAMNLNGRGLAARASGEISDHLSASLALEHRTRDPWVTNVQGPKLENAGRRGVRGKLYYRPDAGNGVDAATGVEVELGLHYLSSDRPEVVAYNQFQSNSVGAFASVVTGGLVPNGLQSDQHGEVFNDTDTYNEVREQGASLRVRAPFATFDLVSISGFSDITALAASDFDATSAPLVFFRGDAMTDRLFTQELQLVSNRDSQMDWIVGTYFLNSTSAYDTLDIPSQTVPGVIDSTYNGSGVSAYAVFAEMTYRFDSAWALIGGGRYSREKVEHRPIRYNGVTVSDSSDAEWSDFSPRLVIQYSVGAHRLYASLSRGFKSGSFNLTDPNELAAVDPETLIAAELGWKTYVPRHNFRFDAALFSYDYKDLQVGHVQSATSPTVLRNAGRAVVRGIDLTLSTTLAERLNLYTGLSWLADAEYERFTDGSGFMSAPIGFAVGPADYSGNRMARAPELTYNIGLDYTQPLSAGRLVFDINWYYSSAYYFSAQNTADNEQQPFNLLSAQVSFYTLNNRWKISVWGKNLTNTEYLRSKLVNAIGILGTYAEPRTYGLEIAYQFRSQPGS